MDSREDLERWIVATRRNRRTLAIACGIGVAIAVALMFWRGAVGGIALAIVAITALCGFWITSSHILDFENKVREIDHPRPKTAHRRIYDR